MNTNTFGQSILHLEKSSDTSFVGTPYDIGWKRLYGGHLIAQSLYATHQSPQKKGDLLSFHCHFLHVGNCIHPLQYNITSLRVGLQSSVFQVQTQQKHRSLFQLCSSYGHNSDSVKHTPQMPIVPSPLDVPNDKEMLHDLRQTFPHSKGLKSFVERRRTTDTGLDIRPISPKNFLHSSKKTPSRLLWFRMRTQFPSDLASVLLAYTSDFLLVGTSLQPHSLSILHPNIKFVSLDHAMWFYEGVPLNSWILLEATSEIYTKGRCLVHGRFFDEKGRFLAKCTQEGFIHIKNQKRAK